MKQQILFIEDDPVLRWIVSKFFDKRDDVETTFKTNGMEGMLWLSSGNFPDLIVTDYLMPLMNGVEFVEALKKSGIYRNIPILILTGYHVEKIDNFYNEGMISEIVQKPFDPEQLVEKIMFQLGEKNASEVSGSH